MSAYRTLRIAAALAAALLAIAPAARALPPEEKDWEVAISMYGWLASVDADVEARGVETNVSMSFRDIFDDLGWAIMGGVEGRYKRLLLLTDVVGMQLVSDAENGPRTRPFQLFPNGPGGELTYGGYDVHTRLTTWILDVKPGFRVWSHPVSSLFGGTEAPEDPRAFDVDLLAGFRYWNVTNKTNVEIGAASATVGGVPVDLPDRLPDLGGDVRVPRPFLNGVDTTVDATTDWWDPIFGLRVSADVTKRWHLSLLGDVGGFSIGNASELTWQALFGSEFAFTEHVALQTGYRALGIQRDGALDNGVIHGPKIGVLFRF